MSLKLSKQRLSIAFIAGSLVAVMVPGLASATPGGCDGSIGQVVKFVTEVNGTPMGGPNETWGWAHPDGNQPNPGQAMQYFCLHD